MSKIMSTPIKVGVLTYARYANRRTLTMATKTKSKIKLSKKTFF